MDCIICHYQDIQEADVIEKIRVGRDVIEVPLRAILCGGCGERYFDREAVRKLEKITDALEADDGEEAVRISGGRPFVYLPKEEYETLLKAAQAYEHYSASQRTKSHTEHYVTEVEYIDGYRLQLTFEDGLRGMIDLKDELYGTMFEPLKDIEFFKQVKVDDELSTIVWPNGVDLAPEFLREAAEKNPVS